MSKTNLCLTALLLLSPVVTFAQDSTPPKDAIFLTKGEIETVRKGTPHPDGTYDQVVKVVDIGKYNVAVAVVRHGTEAVPPSGGYHFGITEVYVILSGSATITTGGTVVDGKRSNEALPTGPNMVGNVQGGVTRHVSAGDVVIIPPGVEHRWDKVDEPVEVLVVRSDAEHVLPAGYINPSLTK